MYGYVVPVKEQLAQADFCLYRSFYCGICKATGKLYGQLPRFTTNYDIVFLSVLLHDVSLQPVTFENKGCVCNPFKKKTTVCRNELLDRLVATNMILSYHKASDDVIDDGAKKKLARAMLKKSYKKAKSQEGEIDEIVKSEYERLRKFESENFVGVDRVADCFSMLLMRIAQNLLGGEVDEKLLKLCYNVGKFVYIIDALDDTTDDFKKKRYNPLIAQYGNFVNRKQFIEDNNIQLQFLISSTINRAIECYNNIIFTQASDLLGNIVRYGLRSKAEEVLKSEKKLPKPKI